MSARGDFYSRFVAWLKILLPIAALAILSTLFLLSRNIDPATTIPFTTIDLRERAREERVTAPELAGATENGDLILFRSASARPDPENPSRGLAEMLSARITLASGSEITFSALEGIVDQGNDRAELTGDVVVTSSTGYEITTDQLISGMRSIRAESPGAVVGTGPPGDFKAGRMLLTTDENGENARLLFTDGIELIYDPQDIEE
ncbi:MAG: lipopolysaccharide export system protein LptC [Rhodobacteraceae bacterium HLUCCO07]|nr:MAG: lipopolysaccharide export system protein LptC [Rhodobacteraceae bacterium HLUCCO07]